MEKPCTKRSAGKRLGSGRAVLELLAGAVRHEAVRREAQVFGGLLVG